MDMDLTAKKIMKMKRKWNWSQVTLLNNLNRYKCFFFLIRDDLDNELDTNMPRYDEDIQNEETIENIVVDTGKTNEVRDKKAGIKRLNFKRKQKDDNTDVLLIDKGIFQIQVKINIYESLFYLFNCLDN